MIVRCRMWRMARSEHVVDAEDYETAPDDFVAAFVDTREAGSISFVEVLEGERWVLWRVEVIMGRPLLLATVQTTEEEAERELEKPKRFAWLRALFSKEKTG